MSGDLAAPTYSGALGDGLVRRWSTAADTERFAVLMGTVFRDERDELPNPRAMHEARLMMQPAFPYMTPGDVAVVEDTGRAGHPLVACTTLWRHQWSYAGIPFAVGRPEMVATDPTYRRRGLVRALFEMVHARSEAEGHLLQAITGIPYFYRQFGYEYALDLDGSRTTYCSLIPAKRDEGPEPCSLRHATIEDVDQIAALYTQGRAGSLVWHEAPVGRWRWMIATWDDPAVREQDVTRIGIYGRHWMILDAEGTVCGYIQVAAQRWGPALSVRELAFAPGADLTRIVPALLRWLRDLGERTPAVRSDIPPCSALRFQLGRAHPLYDVLGEALAPRAEPPYAWYIRIPDVAAFLRHIGPALEARLAGSILAGYTGEVTIDLYRAGLRLRFERGRLLGVDPWQEPANDESAVALGCPPLTFVQLVLSYRDVDELRAILPDVWVQDDRRLLINTLFPRQHSFVDPLG